MVLQPLDIGLVSPPPDRLPPRGHRRRTVLPSKKEPAKRKRTKQFPHITYGLELRVPRRSQFVEAARLF